MFSSNLVSKVCPANRLGDSAISTSSTDLLVAEKHRDLLQALAKRKSTSHLLMGDIVPGQRQPLTTEDHQSALHALSAPAGSANHVMSLGSNSSPSRSSQVDSGESARVVVENDEQTFRTHSYVLSQPLPPIQSHMVMIT
eukprot:Colp12_sorted_trinity150504_noHs@17578